MVHGGGYCHIGTKSNDNEFITDECFGGHLGGNYPPFLLYFFLSVGLVAPRPPPSLFTGSILSWIVPIRLLGCRFHLQTLSLQEKATLKAVWQRLEQSQPHCLILLTSLFTISLYRRICVLMYAYVAVWTYCHIYGYMYIRIALRTILHRMTLYMSPS